MSLVARLTSVLLVAAAAGCGGADTAVPSIVPPAGRYVLQSANGAAAPALVSTWATGESPSDTGSVYLVGDTLQVFTDGSYRESAWFEARTGARVVARTHWFDRGLWTGGTSALRFESNYIENVAFDAALSAAGELATSRDLLGEGQVDYVLRRQ